MLKFCSTCNTEKELTLFSIRKASKDGHTASCKDCISIGKKELPSTSLYNKEYRLQNQTKEKERLALYRESNGDKIIAYKRLYRKEQPLKHAVWDADKRAKRKNRVPKWLSIEDKNQIIEFYKLARDLSKSTNVKHQVDHIVPLSSKTVSGLHVPWNLQILTAHDNNRKNNKYEQQQAVPPQA